MVGGVGGGYVSAGRPKHGCGSVWNLSERPMLSDCAKQRLMGLLEERAEWQRCRVDPTPRPEVLLFTCGRRASEPVFMKTVARRPSDRSCGGRGRDSSSERVKGRQKDKQRQRERGKKSRDSAPKQQDGGVRLMQMCSEMSPHQFASRIVFICFPKLFTPTPSHLLPFPNVWAELHEKQKVCVCVPPLIQPHLSPLFYPFGRLPP